MPRADPPLLGVGASVARPSAGSAFKEIATASGRARTAALQERFPCTQADVCGGLLGLVAGCGLVVGLAFALYPQGFACATEQRAPFSSGLVAALETLVALAPVWGRAAVFAAFAAPRSWPGATVGAPAAVRPAAACTLLLQTKDVRRGAGWVGIVGGESTWAQAREALGLGPTAAIRLALATLLLWHWFQPVSYYVVLEAYKCYPGFMDYDSVGYEGVLAVIVAGREVMCQYFQVIFCLYTS